MTTQREAHQRCAQNPSRFWLDAAQAISWDRAPTIGCETRDTPSGRWFADGHLSACYNAVDRHLEAGRGEQLALVQVSTITGSESRYTYRELRDEVGPVASFQRCHVVARLPKTRSGKVLRATMRAIADDRPYEIPATIEDPAALEEIRASLKAR